MKFIAVHPLESPITKDQITEAASACRAENNNDAYWIDSWTQLNDKGEITVLYCQYDAKDASRETDLQLHIGLHAGDVIVENNNVFWRSS